VVLKILKYDIIRDVAARGGCDSASNLGADSQFTLSFRDVEDLLAERGIVVSY
jgi:hypothetical protein